MIAQQDEGIAQGHPCRHRFRMRGHSAFGIGLRLVGKGLLVQKHRKEDQRLFQIGRAGYGGTIGARRLVHLVLPPPLIALVQPGLGVERIKLLRHAQGGDGLASPAHRALDAPHHRVQHRMFGVLAEEACDGLLRRREGPLRDLAGGLRQQRPRQPGRIGARGAALCAKAVLQADAQGGGQLCDLHRIEKRPFGLRLPGQRHQIGPCRPDDRLGRFQPGGRRRMVQRAVEHVEIAKDPRRLPMGLGQRGIGLDDLPEQGQGRLGPMLGQPCHAFGIKRLDLGCGKRGVGHGTSGGRRIACAYRAGRKLSSKRKKGQCKWKRAGKCPLFPSDQDLRQIRTTGRGRSSRSTGCQRSPHRRPNRSQP